MAEKDKNVQPMVVSPTEVSPRFVEPRAVYVVYEETPTEPPAPPTRTIVVDNQTGYQSIDIDKNGDDYTTIDLFQDTKTLQGLEDGDVLTFWPTQYEEQPSFFLYLHINGEYTDTYTVNGDATVTLRWTIDPY